VSATNYPSLDIFWSMLWFFISLLWLFLVVYVLLDVFRSHDMRGAAKCAWTIIIICLPLIGVLIYLVVRGGSMHKRAFPESADT
jgi:Phospholipase_D-nuclease N-terminal